MIDIPDIEDLIADRALFNAFVYTPIDEAVKELDRRQKNTAITLEDLPSAFDTGPRAVLFRQGFTPNYEVRRFISIVDAISLDPLFIDHPLDKFVAKNEWKYFLGKMYFFLGRDKNGNTVQECHKVINFEGSEGQLMTNLNTLWGQPLIEFHKELFFKAFPMYKNNIFDASEWLSKDGGAITYYKKVLHLFIKNGILFENFLLDKNERVFTKDIFLPAFITVMKETGLKPLIIALEPTEIEGEKFWMYHPVNDKSYVLDKLSNRSQ